MLSWLKTLESIKGTGIVLWNECKNTGSQEYSKHTLRKENEKVKDLQKHGETVPGHRSWNWNRVINSILSRMNSVLQKIRQSRRPFVTLRNMLDFYDEELLVSCPTPKLQDHSLSAICGCLLNAFAATLHMWRPSEDAQCRGDSSQYLYLHIIFLTL
jgi:hypothetical protein